MTDTPLVSVITPTWQRHGMLMNRCMPSVQAQTWPNVEHIIVSDGPDPELHAKLEEYPHFLGHPMIFAELEEHDPALHWGVPARLKGIELARGELIAYLDDDDTYRPDHCLRLAEALQADPKARWAYSLMQSHQPDGQMAVVGMNPLSFGGIGTPMIMHRKDLLEVHTWGKSHAGEDWHLVAGWIGASIKRVCVREVTIDVWPSVYREGPADGRV